MITANYHGHKVTWNDHKGRWEYPDGIDIKSEDRPCTRCGKEQSNKHDACIASLPGVRFACCGHGQGEGYIHFNDGRMIRGTFTVSFECPPQEDAA